MRKYYSGITVFKLAGSLLVLLAHIKLPPVYLALTHRLGGLAQAMAVVVPCFYMVSGFLAYKGWAHARQPRRYISRYLAWVSGVYSLFCAYYLATTTLPDLLTNYRAHTSLASPLHMLFEVFVVKGPVFSLWFVPPLLFGVSATYFFERRGQFRLVCGLAALGFLSAQLTSGSLCALLDSMSYSPFWTSGKHALLLAQVVASYLGIGFPFVVVGAWVARHEARFQALPVGLLATTGMGLFIGEIWFLTRVGGASHQHFVVFSMAPISLLLFHGVLHLQVPSIKAYHGFINRFSMVVFFLHPFLIELNSWLGGWVPYKLTAGQALACVLLTLPETLGVTLLLAAYLDRKRLGQAPTEVGEQPVLQTETALK